MAELRVAPGLVGWDVEEWTGTTRLPGLNATTTRLVQDLVDDAIRGDDDNVCVRRFRDRLASSSYDTSWSFGNGVTGVVIRCLFHDGPRKVGLVIATNLNEVAERTRGEDLTKDYGTVKLLQRRSLSVNDTTVTGPAVVAFDPDEAAGFSITIDGGSPEQLLVEMVDVIADDLTG